MRRGIARVTLLTAAILHASCARTGIHGDAGSDPADAADADDPGDATDTPAEADEDSTDAPVACSCSPGDHNDHIFVLSDDGEMYSYDPVANEFEFVAGPLCGGTLEPYSMAVDSDGIAWMLSSVSHRIMTIDVNAPGECEDSGYSPTPAYGLFGMAFTAESATSICPRLFVLTYSGSGMFREGEDLGELATLDPVTLQLLTVGPTDFDGGELAGTHDGRLFAFAGVEPAKLVTYDRADATEVQRLVLDGLNTTHASAFAFFGGDFYLFTEARGVDCIPCLESSCPAEYDACMGDSFCTEQLFCALDNHEITDECGGYMPSGFIDCLYGECASDCFIPAINRVSRVVRMDYDGSDGPAGALGEVYSQAPIRIVGAGTSPCVPEVPW